MGGGAKKKSIAAAEKAQERSVSKPGESKDEKKPAEQKAGPKSVVTNEELIKTIRKEATKTPLVTPYAIASKYGLKISTAKEILRGFAANNLLKRTHGSRRTMLFTPAPAKSGETAAS